MSKKETISEYNRLKKKWVEWNKKCHHEDRISWNEFLDEHKK